MNSGLEGRVAFITGASGGIGRALAETLAQEGLSLVLHGRSKFDELEAWLSEREWKDRAIAVRADVSDSSEVNAAMEAAVERFGRVDVCVANAGVWPPPVAPLHEASDERVRQVLDTNLLGAIWTARAFLRALAQTGPRADAGCSLVFIGSTAGKFGEAGHPIYATSKAALHGLVQSLKNEIVALDPLGRVNLVQPGWTATHMARPALDEDGTITRIVRTMPLQQIGRAEDIARTVHYLASPTLARHVTGETITVAGGMEGRVQWEPEAIDECAIRAKLRSSHSGE